MYISLKFLKKQFLWLLFFGFAVFAIWTREDPNIFLSQGPYPYGKVLVWIVFFSFLGYSLYSSAQENFFKSLRQILQMFWGRQICIDLYIGLLLPLIIVFIHSGPLVLLIWLVPILIYANLATLLFVALNYDALIAQFV